MLRMRVTLLGAASLMTAVGPALNAMNVGPDIPLPDFDKVDWVRGLENPTEGSCNLVRKLIKNGYSDEDLTKVMGGNALRVLGQVWH